MFCSAVKAKFLSSHPPVEKRLEALYALERELQGT
jgi:hypothetical protein